ncbi:MAG: MOSC domain-containing protein [Chloroflexi bacterium]|nr:MOSC domain-containing protein [Chloroflexota bacterium]
MHLISVNVAKPQLLTGTARGDVMSSIHKRPVEGPVTVRRLNVDGDAQGDPTVHGGPDAAVYVYAFEDYAFWTAQLKREIDSFGWFGENLTVEGASSDAMCFGDVWRVGGALLQVTEPRSPCFKLDHKMGIRYFAARFRRSGRVGFYNRVLEEGTVQAGDEATLVEPHPARISIRLLSDVRHAKDVSVDDVERVLAVDNLPIAQRHHAERRMRRIKRVQGIRGQRTQ